MKFTKQAQRKKIHHRIRRKVQGTAERPRLSIYKSNTTFYAQMIDDKNNATILAIDSRKFKGKGMKQVVETAKELAEKAKKQKIFQIIFDRSGYTYQGRVRAFSETVRQEGIKH